MRTVTTGSATKNQETAEYALAKKLNNRTKLCPGRRLAMPVEFSGERDEVCELLESINENRLAHFVAMIVRAHKRAYR